MRLAAVPYRPDMSHKTYMNAFYAAIAILVIVAFYLLFSHSGQESWIIA